MTTNFVDFAGMNTLISSSFDDTNILTSGRNTEVFTAGVPVAQELVGINLHRNGPYGYSTWKQLRVSENPLTRHHVKEHTMTFVTEPGPIRIINIDDGDELRIRQRYSGLYSYQEPPITQKAYPVIWNVGRHYKDGDGNIDFSNLQKFSIMSSYGNQQIAFANDKVSKLHKFDVDEEETEYSTIKEMYLDGGLNKQDSPLTYWEFLQYRETVFPKPAQQYTDQSRTRPQFESFYRHLRTDRNKILVTSSIAGPHKLENPGKFGIHPLLSGRRSLYQSTWPMDEHQSFLIRAYSSESGSVTWESDDEAAGSGRYRAYEGSLMNTLTQFWNDMGTQTNTSNLNSSASFYVETAATEIDKSMKPHPLYMRRTSLDHSASVSNPSGMLIYGTGSSITKYQGGALWEAGDKRQIRNEDGTYTSSPKHPFYDTYENYAEDLKKYGKNYSIIPEFRMSEQIEDYLRTDGEIELDMFEVPGGVSGSENSSKNNFYEIYSNSDFMKNFEVISDDHKDFTNGKVLSLRCKAIKKFLPYEGFYPCQRTVKLAERFYDSFQNNIKLYNSNNVELDGFNYSKQAILAPLFAPGVLFNTIKSGVAVDYPVVEGTLDTQNFGSQYFATIQNFDKRVPFEALIEPQKYLSDFKICSNEPDPYGNLQAAAEWDGQGDELYAMMANNFLAETINFFLPNGQLSSVVSKKQKDIKLVSGSVYGMRVKMRRSMNGTRGSVYHIGTSSVPYRPPQDVTTVTGSNQLRETFTMYSRPSAFGPPTWGFNQINSGVNTGTATFHYFGFPDRDDLQFPGGTAAAIEISSERGFNFPFTPPYYHGEGWCQIYFTASSPNMTIEEIQAASNYEYTRFDSSYIAVTSSSGLKKVGDFNYTTGGPQSFKDNKINKNAVQLSSSLNINGVGTIKSRAQGGTAGSLVVDSGLDEENRWIIQTKFETPMLNFNHISGSDHLTLPSYGAGSVPRGMWHQYGRLPEENEGVYLQVGAIPKGYQTQVMGRTTEMQDMSEALGFSGVGTKLGKIALKKEISEAVVAVPFIEEAGRKKFFLLDHDKIEIYKNGPTDARYASLTTGPPASQIGRSVLKQIEAMKKYIFPPSFDFMSFDIERVPPIAMYIFEFSHTLSQVDLQDIWQNLPPDIGQEMEVSEVAITHPILKKELLGIGGEGGNDVIEMPNRLKWMVFKVKQRAANNYFKKTVLRNSEVNTEVESGNVTQDEFGQTSAIQYNWPYDFFSLVEMVKIDAEVEMGNADFSNYVDHIPSWTPVEAENLEPILADLEDHVLPEVRPTASIGDVWQSHGGDDDPNDYERQPGWENEPTGFKDTSFEEDLEDMEKDLEEKNTDMCFVAGTKIVMGDGSTRNIEDIKVGDEVMSYNFSRDVVETQEVVKLMSPIHSDIVEFVFDNKVSTKHTYDHPYWVKEKGWASYKPELTISRYASKTKDLEAVTSIQVGDSCLDVDGSYSKILEINQMDLVPTQTYNFEVAENNNYFADGMLVHNKVAGGGPGAPKADEEKTGGLTTAGMDAPSTLGET